MTRNRKLGNIFFVILVALILAIVYLYKSKSPESIGFRPAAAFISVGLKNIRVAFGEQEQFSLWSGKLRGAAN